MRKVARATDTSPLPHKRPFAKQIRLHIEPDSMRRRCTAFMVQRAGPGNLDSWISGFSA